MERDRPPTVVLDPKPLMEGADDVVVPLRPHLDGLRVRARISRFAPRLTSLVFVLAALIGFSRIYVGVHYPLDVVAGAVFGCSSLKLF